MLVAMPSVPPPCPHLSRPRLPFPVAWTAALLATAVASAADLDRVAVKRLFAPPTAVLDGSLRLPAPTAGAVASTAALRTIDGVDATVEFVHGGGPLRALPIAAPGFRGRLVLETIDGRRNAVALPVGTIDDAPPRIAARPVALDALGIGAETSFSETTLPAGRYRLRFEGDAGTPAYAALGDDSDAALVAHRATALVRAGEPLVIRVGAWRPATAPPLADLRFADRALAGAPLACRIESARVRWSDGTIVFGTTRREADGAWSLAFPAAIAGDALVEIDATVRDGRTDRSRSVALLTRVAADDTRVAGPPRLEARDDGWCELALPVVSDRDALVAATELWAIGPAGERCLGWLGGIAEVEHDEDFGRTVRLGAYAAQLTLAADERLECREVRLHEREGHATLDLVPRIEATVAEEARLAIGRAVPADRAAPDTDWMGRPGVATVAAPSAAALAAGAGSHARVLLHGYCAGANPWPLAPFGPEAYAYEVPGQNWPNDTFALDLLQRTGDFKSFGTIAHSQGGMAALHLATFYFSGLDWAGPGRLIQAVGAPFEGTPIAGVLAALGAVFGVQCGANYDLTPEGAALWLSTIPPEPRAKVFTFTTSYTGPGWSGYCSLATALFLAFPEDGVTEHAAGHFPGANDLGLTYGWCHVGGMRDPAQTFDASRNANMAGAGAR